MRFIFIEKMPIVVAGTFHATAAKQTSKQRKGFVLEIQSLEFIGIDDDKYFSDDVPIHFKHYTSEDFPIQFKYQRRKVIDD